MSFSNFPFTLADSSSTGAFGTAIEKPKKTINKQRQVCACDYCRKVKKKCEGGAPCARCNRLSLTCTYSARKRANKTAKTQQIATLIKKDVPLAEAASKPSLEAQQLINIDTFSPTMMNRMIRNEYLHLYFTSLNPFCKSMHRIDTNRYENIQSRGISLQYCAALAGSARACYDKRISKSFENHAQRFAASLFDDFSLDTALGFVMLSYHYWGEDFQKAKHFAAIASSICDRLLERHKSNTEICEQLLLIQLNTLYLCGFISEDSFPTLTKFVKQIKKKVQKYLPNLIVSNTLTVNDSDPFSLPEILLVCESQAELHEQAIKMNSMEEIHPDPFIRVMDTSVRQKMDILIMKFERLENLTPLMKCSITMAKAIAAYCCGAELEGIGLIEESLQQTKLLQHLISYSEPNVMVVNHLAFMIAFQYHRFDLCIELTGVQRKLISVFPAGAGLLQYEMNMLRMLHESGNRSCSDSDVSSLPFATRSSITPQQQHAFSLFAADDAFLDASLHSSNYTYNNHTTFTTTTTTATATTTSNTTNAGCLSNNFQYSNNPDYPINNAPKSNQTMFNTTTSTSTYNYQRPNNNNNNGSLMNPRVTNFIADTFKLLSGDLDVNDLSIATNISINSNNSPNHNNNNNNNNNNSPNNNNNTNNTNNDGSPYNIGPTCYIPDMSAQFPPDLSVSWDRPKLATANNHSAPFPTCSTNNNNNNNNSNVPFAVSSKSSFDIFPLLPDDASDGSAPYSFLNPAFDNFQVGWDEL